jgi:hypothetical protein
MGPTRDAALFYVYRTMGDPRTKEGKGLPGNYIV